MSNSKEASYIAINCVDGLHPIDHSCTRFALGVFLKSVLFSGKIYFPLYLLGAITSGKIRSPKYMIQNFFPNVLRSSVFIASIGGLWVRLACFMYAIRGEHHKLIMFFSPIIASFIGIILEKKERRSELTIYVAQQAVESLTRMAMSRKYIPYIPNFMMYLYAFSLSCLLYFQKNEPHLIGSSSKSLLKLFIPVETQPDLPEKYVTRFLVSLKRFVLSGRENLIQKDQIIAERNFSEISSPSSSEDESESTDRIYYEKIRQQPKKVICPHKEKFHIGCILYTLIGFSRSFLMGIGIRGFFLLLPRLMNPRKIKKDGLVLADKGSLNLGMFLGLMTGLSRGVQCLLRYIRGTEDGLNQLIAGLISGVAFYYNGSTEVCMYVASKASEGFYNMLVHRGLISPLPHGEVALFTVCTSILFYNAMVAPHDLRPSYLRFLGRTSGYYFSHIALWFTKVREKFRGGMYHNLEDYEKAMRLVNKIAEKNPL